MKVLVSGSRHWSDVEKIREYILEIKPSEVCHGGARGADQIAGEVCRAHNIPCHVYNAEWSKYGKRAGIIRNLQMLTKFIPDLVLAFHENLSESKGTRHCVEAALKRHIDVRIIS